MFSVLINFYYHHVKSPTAILYKITQLVVVFCLQVYARKVKLAPTAGNGIQIVQGRLVLIERPGSYYALAKKCSTRFR